MVIRRLCVIIGFLFLCAALQAQEFTPVVHAFSKTDYGADSQNWAIETDRSGIVYVGNNRGLLSFDGFGWDLYSLPKNKVVRSLLCDEDRIYAGGFEEFGYFRRGKDGRLTYTSLSSALEGYSMQNDEIWRILKMGRRIVFQAFRSWFMLENGQVTPVRSESFVEFFSQMGEQVFARSEQYGFARVNLEAGTLVPVPGTPFSSPCINILPFDGEVRLLVTYADGLYLWGSQGFSCLHTQADDILRKAQVNVAISDEKGRIIVGTRLDGALCLDREGRLLWHIDSDNVLPGNTVLDMNADRDGNLWMALGSGIAMANLHSNLRLASSLKPSVGDIYTAAWREPYLYMGTSQGLFRANKSGDKITDIRINPRVNGHVQDLSFVDGQLFAGTNASTYELVGTEQVREVSPVTGGSCIARGSIHGKEVLIQGTYTSLCVYVKEQGRWRFSHIVKGFMEPVGSIRIDYKGTVWAGHIHEGLYRIRLTADLDRVAFLETFDSLDGEHSLPMKVLSFASRVVFTDGLSGFYTYDDLQDKLVPFEDLNRAVAGFSPFNGIIEAGPDRYWFISEREAVLMQWDGDQARPLDIVPYRLLGGRPAASGQRILSLGNGEYLFTLDNALAVYRPVGENLSRRHPVMEPVTIRISDRTMAAADSLLPLTLVSPKIPYRFRNISFRMACPVTGLLQDVRFRTRLEGLDPDWEEIHGAPEATYNYLPSGSYRFRIQAIDYDGSILSEWAWPFSIRPPLWRSAWAILLYALLLAAVVLSVVRFFVQRHRKQLERLEKERLEEEVKLKSKELASTIMGSIQKREVLIDIKEELSAQKAALGKAYPDKYYHKICSIIDSQLGSEADWSAFESNFDNIHSNFFSTLRERYPSLTDTDLRFCAYLHLNLTSKDIASLMNISLKGVEAARSRIRKKIQLPKNQSLTSFMIDLK